MLKLNGADETRAHLVDYFRPYNERLRQPTGIQFRWIADRAARAVAVTYHLAMTVGAWSARAGSRSGVLGSPAKHRGDL